MSWRHPIARGRVASRKRRGSVPLRLIAIVAVGAAAVACALVFLPRQAAGGSREGKRADHRRPASEPTQTLVLDQFLVNLADTDATRYCQLELALEVTGLGPAGGREGKGEEGLPVALKCVINDAVVEEISAHTFHELATVEGKQRLKEALKKRVAACLAERSPQAELRQVLFVSLVMQ